MNRGQLVVLLQRPSRDEGLPLDPADPDAVYTFYSRYVAAIALRLLGRDEEVNDSVQEVFLAAISGLKRIRHPQAIKSWLTTVTLRVVRAKLRRRRLHALLGLDALVDYTTIAAPGASPEDRAQIDQLYHLLDRMPAAPRLAWALRYIEEHPLADVARMTNCSLATAKRRIAWAQQRLEQALGNE